MIPPILVEKAGKLEAAVREKFPALAPLARQCFLNTIQQGRVNYDQYTEQ